MNPYNSIENSPYQTIASRGSYNNLLLSGSGTKTIGASTISGNFAVKGTAIASLTASRTYIVASLTLGNTGRNLGTWGGTGSGATNINTNYLNH